MTDILVAVVSEAERKSFTTLRQLSEQDMDNIWASVASFIEQQMAMQKGVCIPGLGTFTFSQLKLDVGSKYVLIQRPVFLLSERLCQSHGLRQNKPLAAAGDIPVVPLNFTALSVDGPFERDVVEGCVRETLLLLLRAVSTQRTVLLTFRGIGILSFLHSTVKMKFYKDFLSSMDGTGKLLWAMCNRPGTSSSVVSERLPGLQRPTTSKAILLPRISEGEPQKERCEHEDSDPTKSPAGQEAQPSAHQKSRLPIVKTNAVNSTDGPETKVPSDTMESHPGLCQPPEGTAEQMEVKEEQPVFNLACVNHTRAGQELCYLCMQRAQRNVPLYVAEERRREEQEEAKVLLLAEQQRAEQFLQIEQAIQEQKRKDSRKISAFNLTIAEALRAKKSAKTSQFEGSYIFSGRPVTPPAMLKQRRYMHELMEQVVSRRKQHKQSQEDQELTDRLHQFQLAEEITKQRSQELHQKKENVKNLQKALSTQLQHRPTGIPARQPDSDGPVFGVRDRALSALIEQKHRAHTLYQEQLKTAISKRKEMLFNHLNEQKKERNMLQRNQKELLADRISCFERLRNTRASLENTWSRSADLKRHRDLEERAFMRSGSRLLLDQCEQYHRCYQCKRKTSNCGQSNIWKDSHFIPGSRLMV